jgi:hypothetical protein
VVRRSRCPRKRSTTSRSKVRPSRAAWTSNAPRSPRNSRDISRSSSSARTSWGQRRHQFLGGRFCLPTSGRPDLRNAIFGTVGNSAPGLDAISGYRSLELYSAEYGGTAGVVVTTKRAAAALGTPSATSTPTT